VSELIPSRQRPLISGLITDSDRPIAHARVGVSFAPRPMPDVAAVTDENGRFSFASAGPGRHELVVVADGFSAQHVTVFVRSHPIALEVPLQPAPSS